MGRKDGRTDDGLTGRKRPGGSDRSLGESSCTQNKQTNRERERERETQYFLEGCQSSWAPKRPIGGLTDKGDHQGLSLARSHESPHSTHTLVGSSDDIRPFVRRLIRSFSQANLKPASDQRSAISNQ